MTKSDLRKSYLAKRRLLTTGEREAISTEIATNFFRDFDLSGVKVFHCFIPIQRFAEVDTRPIFQRIWSEFPHIQTVVPRVNHEIEELESLKYGPDVELAESRWRISEPVHDEHVDADEIDMVLVPLLCFDRKGHRVGYGKGYYDRFLRGCRDDCKEIGLSSFDPVDEISDAYEGDVKLHAAITPAGTINF
jgi:5-formyltetrahydrofolate cyclo-ligase